MFHRLKKIAYQKTVKTGDWTWFGYVYIIVFGYHRRESEKDSDGNRNNYQYNGEVWALKDFECPWVKERVVKQKLKENKMNTLKYMYDRIFLKKRQKTNSNMKKNTHAKRAQNKIKKKRHAGNILQTVKISDNIHVSRPISNKDKNKSWTFAREIVLAKHTGTE